MLWLMDSMPYAMTHNLTSPHKSCLSNPHLDYSSRVNPNAPCKPRIHAGYTAYTRTNQLIQAP
jgi:hypothetical protein